MAAKDGLLEKYLSVELHPDRMEDLYKSEADPWFYWESFRIPYRKLVVQPVLDFINPKNNSLRVLDVGCGVGTLGDALLRTSEVLYTGLDISQTACDRARKNLKPFEDRASFVAANYLEWQKKDRSYDLVAAINSSDYYEGELRKHFMSKSCRLTKKWLLIGASSTGFHARSINMPGRMYKDKVKEAMRFSIPNITAVKSKHMANPNIYFKLWEVSL